MGSLNSYIRSSVGSIFFLFPMKVAECTAQTELLQKYIQSWICMPLKMSSQPAILPLKV